MFNRFLAGIALCILTSSCAYSFSDTDYLNRFNEFRKLNNSLTETPSDKFITFINEDKPLSLKLRERWLYKLAEQKNWADFIKYYKPQTSQELQCHYAVASYNINKKIPDIQQAKSIYLSPSSLPDACNQLFTILKSSNQLHDEDIIERIKLSLNARNIGLASYLTKQLSFQNSENQVLLNNIAKNPRLITKLNASPLHQIFHVFGLKRLVSLNMDTAIQYYEIALKNHKLNEASQQAFLAHVALYKSMRDQKDTVVWFNKIKPQYYNETLLDWLTRYHLKNKNWSEVLRLTSLPNLKNEASWQYWQARSLDKLKQHHKAQSIYKALAQKRNYYGFLASRQLNQPPAFEHELENTNINELATYHEILEEIKSLYQQNQDGQASKLVNDFMLELPKEKQSAVICYISKDLSWHFKAIQLSTNDTFNNLVNIRFPLSYEKFIQQLSKKYQIPEAYIYAIIRQESQFKENTISFAGAYGLMQLMPRTAYLVTHSYRIPYHNKSELFAAQKNIEIGVAYLNQLSKHFNRDPITMAAAYNAGPHMAKFWHMKHNTKEIDLWIDTIPWQETRNYLKNVAAFYTVYQYRLKQKASIQNAFDRL